MNIHSVQIGILKIEGNCCEVRGIETREWMKETVKHFEFLDVTLYSQIRSEDFEESLLKIVDLADVEVIITIGGIGFSCDDIVPEVILKHMDRQATGLLYQVISCLSAGAQLRPVAGIIKDKLILTLPDSENDFQRCLHDIKYHLLDVKKDIGGKKNTYPVMPSQQQPHVEVKLPELESLENMDFERSSSPIENDNSDIDNFVDTVSANGDIVDCKVEEEVGASADDCYDFKVPEEDFGKKLETSTRTTDSEDSFQSLCQDENDQKPCGQNSTILSIVEHQKTEKRERGIKISCNFEERRIRSGNNLLGPRMKISGRNKSSQQTSFYKAPGKKYGRTVVFKIPRDDGSEDPYHFNKLMSSLLITSASDQNSADSDDNASTIQAELNTRKIETAQQDLNDKQSVCKAAGVSTETVSGSQKRVRIDEVSNNETKTWNSMRSYKTTSSPIFKKTSDFYSKLNLDSSSQKRDTKKKLDIVGLHKINHFLADKDIDEDEVTLVNMTSFNTFWFIRREDMPAKTTLDENLKCLSEDDLQPVCDRSKLLPEHHYLCRFENSYLRCQVMSVSELVSVLLVDSGRIAKLSFSQLYYLPVKISLYPILTMCFTASQLKPVKFSDQLQLDKILPLFANKRLLLKNCSPCNRYTWEGDLYIIQQSEMICNKVRLENVTNFMKKFGLLEYRHTSEQAQDLSRDVESAFLTDQPELLADDSSVDLKFENCVTSSFEGILSGIDSNGTLWILPSRSFDTQHKLQTGIQKCKFVRVDDSEIINIGDILMARETDLMRNINQNNLEEKDEKCVMLRILILKMLGPDMYQGVLIDRLGELTIVSRSELFQIPEDLKAIPILSVPVQLYGLKKKEGTASPKVHEHIKRKFRGISCQVLTKVEVPKYPVQAEVILQSGAECYSLACFLNEHKYYEQCGSLTDWQEVAFHEQLSWLNGKYKSSVLEPLKSMFFVQKNDWFPLDIVAFPVGSEDCDDSLANSNLVTVQPRTISPNIDFSVEIRTPRDKIAKHLRETEHRVKHINKMFAKRKMEYNRLAKTRASKESWTTGEACLVYYEDLTDPALNEWARGVIKEVAHGKANVFFTDFGYEGPGIEFSKMRSLTWTEFLEPVHCFNIRFDNPGSGDLQRIRSQLSDFEISPRLAKVKNVDLKTGDITVSVFEFRMENNKHVLHKII